MVPMKITQFIPQSAFNKIKTVYDHVPEDAKPTNQNEAPFAGMLKEFVEGGGDRSLQPGEILLREDDPAENMYWIESGVLAILQGNLKNPHLLGFRYPGQIVGELALLENIPRTASAVAVVPTTLKSLSKEKFRAFLNLIPGVGVEIMRLLSSRLRQIQPAEYSAGLYDPLTGALSRQTLDERLQNEIERARLYRYSFSLAFIELDRFKEINESHGPDRGDEVLSTFAQRINANLRTSDLFFRYSGTEFVLILQDTSETNSKAMLQRMLDEMRDLAIPGDPLIHLSFNAGVAHFPEDGHSAAELLKAAQGRVVQAKASGKPADPE
jgi:diguanylate cyclase (GGDEF)-like protein